MDANNPVLMRHENFGGSRFERLEQCHKKNRVAEHKQSDYGLALVSLGSF
jgi:hypothetical protein